MPLTAAPFTHISLSPDTLARGAAPVASSTVSSSTSIFPGAGDRQVPPWGLTLHAITLGPAPTTPDDRQGLLWGLTSNAITLGPTPTTPEERQPTVVRGDLPPQLDSEEVVGNVTGLLFSPPEDVDPAPSGPPHNDTAASQTSSIGPGPSGDLGGNTSELEESFQEVTDVADPVGESEGPAVSDLDYLFEGTHTPAAQDVSKAVTSDAMSVNTPSFQGLRDKWTWFYVVLRGNCFPVDLNNSNVLFSDFITSFSRLVLYDEDHIEVDSMACSGQKMTVNMSINSIFYPECEGDLQTLRSHRNLRIDIHNSSFYVESFETKRTLIFETKPDIEEDHSDVLYLTLGGVGVSLMCIVFAGILFAIYQYCVLRKAKLVFAQENYPPDSPRSLRPKKDKDPRVKFSQSRTYTVNMYKSYNDLSSGDLYSPLDSRDSSGTKDNSSKASTNSKTPKKTNGGKGDFTGFPKHQQLWSESLTQSTEEFMTLRNVDNNTSSFKGVAKEPDKESLHPLLLNGRPSQRSDKTTETPDALPTPPTCPASPSIPKGVLKRMDDLISSNFSNSSPNISTNGAYVSAYSDTMINKSSSPNSNTNPDSSRASNTNTSSSSTSGRKAASRVPPTSAENLCLTRITFLGTENPSFRMETDM